MKSRVVTATEFKTKCLTLLHDIQQRGESITITRRGVPVAVLGPAPKLGLEPKGAWKSPKNSWAGRGRIVGDIVNTSDLWCVHEK